METLEIRETMGKISNCAWLLIAPLLALILVLALGAKKMMMDESEKNVVGLLIFGFAIVLCLIMLVLHMSYIPPSPHGNALLMCWLGGIMSLACIVIIVGLRFKWPGFTPPATTFLQFLLSTPLIAFVLTVMIGIKILLKH